MGHIRSPRKHAGLRGLRVRYKRLVNKRGRLFDMGFEIEGYAIKPFAYVSNVRHDTASVTPCTVSPRSPHIQVNFS